MTQLELAGVIGLERTSVTNIERGSQRFLVHTLVQVAQALGVPPADLLPGPPEEDLEKLKATAQESDRDPSEREWVERALQGGDDPREKR